VKYFLPLLLLVSPLCAQWVVTDPANQAVNLTTQAKQAAAHVEIINRWAEQQEKLNEQIRQAQDLIALQQRVRDILGDPVRAGERLLTVELGQTELGRHFGETLAATRRLARAADTLHNTVDDTYAALDDRTVLGRFFPRDLSFYKRYAVVERQAETVNVVQQATDAQMSRLQADLAATLVQLKEATTQSEVAKLQAVAAALTGQIAHLDAVRREEADKLRALQLMNENQAAKERTDLAEKQAADERDAMSAVNAWQKSIKLTPTKYNR
jgi:hypothetical protein